MLRRVPCATQFLRTLLNNSLIFCSTEWSMMEGAVSVFFTSLFPGTSKVYAIQLVPNKYLWNEFMSQHINRNGRVLKNFPPNHCEHLRNIPAYNRRASLGQEYSVCLVFGPSSSDDAGHSVTNLVIRGSPLQAHCRPAFPISKIQLPLGFSCSQTNARKDVRFSSLTEA